MIIDKIRSLLKTIKSVVVHSGKAHLDDFISASIALVIGGVSIYRRDPNKEELEDSSVLVLDVGMTHDTNKLCFDHHQRAKTDAPKCALKLLCEWLGIDEAMQEAYLWYSGVNTMDTCGPTAVSKSLSITTDQLLSVISNPLGSFVLEQFEQHEHIVPGEPLHDLMRQFGEYVLDGLDEYEDRMCFFSKMNCTFEVKSLKGIICPTTEIKFLQSWKKKVCPTAAFSISYDDRGAGCVLYRYDDCPRINLTKLEGHAGVSFTHKGGFIAKTKTLSFDDAKALMTLAISDPE